MDHGGNGEKEQNILFIWLRWVHLKPAVFDSPLLEEGEADADGHVVDA